MTFDDFVSLLVEILSEEGHSDAAEKIVLVEKPENFDLTNDGGLDSHSLTTIGCALEENLGRDLPWEKSGFPTKLGEIFELAQKTPVDA